MEKGFQHHRRRVAVITLKAQRVMRAELAGEQALGKGGEGTSLHCTGISDLGADLGFATTRGRTGFDGDAEAGIAGGGVRPP